MTLPPSLHAWIRLFLVLLIVAMALGNMVLLAGAVYLLLLALVGVLLTPPGGVAVIRSLARTTCGVGGTVVVKRRVAVEKGIGPMFVHDALPDEMQVEEGNNFHAIWKWPGRKSYDLSYRILCPKRGRFALDETAWEAEAPMRLGRRSQGTGGSTLEIAVVPRVQDVRRIKPVRARAVSSHPGVGLARIGVSTTDFIELRPYSPGDPVKNVNWKASARHSGSRNPLLVNNYEPEARRAVWLFLDGASYMEVGTTLSNTMEHAVEVASILAQFYVSRGYTLGAYVYNSPGGFLPPDAGQKQFHRLTQLLLNLQAGSFRQDLSTAVEWCKSFLFRLQPQVFVITRLDAHYYRPGPGRASFEGLLDGVNPCA